MADHGAGIVERSIAANTMTLSLENNFLRQRIDIHPFVVKKSQASNKKTIVVEDILCIVPNDGKPKLFL